MNELKIEIGENESQSFCHCCDKASNAGHGYIYKNKDAYAVYYASWSSAHPDKFVSFAIAIGEWDDNATAADRTCFGLKAFDGVNDILFHVIDPNESPWGSTELLGEMLSRKDGLDDSLLDDVLVIAECIVRNHPAIANYMD